MTPNQSPQMTREQIEARAREIVFNQLDADLDRITDLSAEEFEEVLNRLLNGGTTSAGQ